MSHHGYSLRPRNSSSTPNSSSSSSSSSSSPPTPSPPQNSSIHHSTLAVPSTRPSPVSPTKRKFADTSSDEDEYEDHIGSASDKLHEFHKVKISTKAESDVREAAKAEQATKLAQLQLDSSFSSSSSSPSPSPPIPAIPPQPSSSTPPQLLLTELAGSTPPLTRTSTQSLLRNSSSPPPHATPASATPPTTLTYAPSSWGYITSKGGRKENQDFYTIPHEEMIDTKDLNTALVFGVFDGHGSKGHDAARECGRCIHSYFTTTNARTPAQDGVKTQEWVDLTLRDAFKTAQETLIQIEMKSKQILDYGTTACVAVIRPAASELTIAWAGDARAAVVRWETVASTPKLSDDTDPPSGAPGMPEKASTFIYNNASNLINSPTPSHSTSTSTGETRVSELTRTASKGSNHEDGACSPFLNCESTPGSPASSTTTVEDSSAVQPTLQVVELTQDHVPQREDERARVLQHGGVIRRVGNVVRVVAGGNFTEEQLKQQRLALNITRSLGHIILSRYGISHEPDVLKTAIQQDDILLIASDGLWNELSSSEISSIALDCKMAGFSPQKFCNMLLRRAEVVSKLKGISSDNITIVVYHHTFS